MTQQLTGDVGSWCNVLGANHSILRGGPQIVRKLSVLREFSAVGRAAVLAATAFGFAATASATPTFDTFGPLPQANFGGSGIPNDAVAQSTFEGTGILALSATERFSNPPVGDDGAGTYFAEPGFNDGTPGSTSGLLGALWNFNIFISAPTGQLLEDFVFTLRYDFDPSLDTPESELGRIDIVFQPGTVLQGSQNNLFDFLATPAVGLTPPTFGPFDPNVPGQYSYVLTASFLDGTELGRVAIDVNVGLPEPGTLALFGLGLVGLAVARRRHRRG